MDVRVSVFAAASKITFFELLTGFAFILVNSGGRKNDLRPLISNLEAIKSLQLYILYFPLYIGKWLIFSSSYLVKCLFYLGS